jgi:hypothetical protein
MRGLSSNQIVSIAFFLTAIFISLALSRIPALISNRDAEMPSFYMEGMSQGERRIQQAAKAAAEKAKKAAEAAKKAAAARAKALETAKKNCKTPNTWNGSMCITKLVPKSLGALSVKATGGKQSASLKK